MQISSLDECTQMGICPVSDAHLILNSYSYDLVAICITSDNCICILCCTVTDAPSAAVAKHAILQHFVQLTALLKQQFNCIAFLAAVIAYNKYVSFITYWPILALYSIWNI